MTIRTIPTAIASAATALSLITLGAGGSAAFAQPVASQTHPRCADDSAAPGAHQIDQGHYRFILSVGHTEHMYTQSQVDAQGVSSGELMLHGTMNSPMNMGMNGGTRRHVEVSICDLTTGTVLRGATVHMSIAPSGDAYMPMSVAEMRGLDEPRTMSHYGNNVVVPSSPYRVKVKAMGQKAVFRVTR